MEREVARLAAKWWADQLRQPATLDNGDDTSQGAMTASFAYMLQKMEREKQSADKIDAFENALANILERHNDPWFSFGVDYNPDRILSEAAEAAELDLGMTTLPWKTRMFATDEQVKVSVGYRGEPQVIYQRESVPTDASDRV